MKNKKTIVIATFLLGSLLHSPFILSLSTDAEQILNSEDIITEPISSDEIQETASTAEQEKEAAKIQSWDNHLDALKEKDQYWDKNSNTPTNDWKEEAFRLAKEDLDKDTTIADALKSAFFNTITEKIKIEEGEFTASTYALIKEFDDMIDAHVKSIQEAEAVQAEKVKEAEAVEPVVESTSTPVETQTPPASSVEEAPITPVETSSAATAPARDISQEWQNQLEKIISAGNPSEIGNLFGQAYKLAQELLSQGYTQESLFSGFEYALIQHNTSANVFPININQAIEAFTAETGIQVPYNKQMQYEAEMQTQAEQQVKQKETELKAAATMQAIKQANIPESKMQELNRLLQEKLATEEATRIAQQRETEAQIASLKQELASLRKPTIEKVPEAQQGIIGKAIGAVKGAASAATAWWYGAEAQDQKDIEALDKERSQKLQEIINNMTLTSGQKLTIEENWNTFIKQIRTFKDINTNDAQATQQWLTTIEQALENLIITHNILSIKDAIVIMKDAIKQYPESTKYINDIKTYLTEKQQRIIVAKQQEENIKAKKIQEKENRKELAQRKQQKIKDEKERKKSEQHIVASYEHEKIKWQQFLTHIANNKQATEQDNIAYTNEAIKKAESLLNPAQLIVLKDKSRLEQDLKEQFTNALLQQQGNEHKVNIHKNMDQFNTALDKITK